MQRSTTRDGAGASFSSDGLERKPTSKMEPSQESKPQPKKPSKIKQLWTKTGLDIPTLMTMFKGSLSPTIAIAMYQSKAVATQYTTLGYLIAIVTILSFAIMPRAKFLQTLSLSLIAVCLGSALVLLALWTSVQARIHTTPLGSTATYNSSQSAVCAIWLFFFVYGINVLRAARPQLQFPAIISSIFLVVGLTYGPQFPTMTYVTSFVRRLLITFLTGFGIATPVSLFVFPVSCRKVVFKQMTGCIMSLRGLLKAQAAYMRSLETIEPPSAEEVSLAYDQAAAAKSGPSARSILATPEAAALKGAQGAMAALHAKLRGDLPLAKREVAFGKLDAKDISEMFKLLRSCFLPANGLCSLIDILERGLEEPYSDLSVDEQKQLRHKQLEDLHFIMITLHESFAEMTGSIDQALEHILLVLELKAPPKKKGEPNEIKGSELASPGEEGFAASYAKHIEDFGRSKQVTLMEWCEHKGITLPENFFDSNSQPTLEHWMSGGPISHDRRQRQLFFMLFLEALLLREAKAILSFVRWADEQRKSGKLSKKRFLFPGQKRLMKWVTNIIHGEDATDQDHFMNDLEAGGSSGVFFGDAFGKRKDPEHLPAETFVQRVGDRFRSIPRFFRSDYSAFGFRVACATMSIAIINYLHSTQTFFLEQRLLWSEIMIAISMTRTAGQSTFVFGLRVFGTFLAMCAAYVIWYIVDAHAPGVIIFLWLYMFCSFYIVLKLPKFVIIGIISIVTSVLIIGYELQVQVLGVTVSESNGQAAYPIYELAPYRLAAVTGGLLVAWIWTIFPYPVSENTELRKDLGAAFYLLANYYSVVHETLRMRVRGDGGDPKVKGTPAYQLEVARDKVFAKTMLLITNMKTNSAFSKYQLRLGGKFPRKTYQDLIEKQAAMLSYTSLISYASSTITSDDNGDSDAQERSLWSAQFRKMISSIDSTSHEVTSLLSLLSSSLTNGQPLPPYLSPPRPFQIVKKLEEIDKDILGLQHITEPEYSAFAVCQIAAQCLTYDLKCLTMDVKSLVGEIDFTFHTVSTSQSSSSSSFADSASTKSKTS